MDESKALFSNLFFFLRVYKIFVCFVEPGKKKEAKGISVKIKLDATDENDAFKR